MTLLPNSSFDADTHRSTPTLSGMMSAGQLTLRNRTFGVATASVSFQAGACAVDIQAFGEEFDGEEWAPRLYHQGLKLPATELRGIALRWSNPPEPGYAHPEFGFIHVFGHHAVRDCTLKFRAAAEGQIELEWVGICDVLWSEEFRENVPFRCMCVATVHAG